MRFKLLLFLSLLAAACACPQPGAGQVAFAPGDAPDRLVTAAVDGAAERVDAAVYAFTLEAPAQALIRAARRGVAVRFLTDRTEAQNPPQARLLAALRAAGIPVRAPDHPGLMHLKLLLVDGRRAALGSFNWTVSAVRTNDEVFVLLEDPTLTRTLAARFEALWAAARDIP